jgi:hypothetical protein
VDCDVPVVVLDVLRRVCLALPEAYEERAWVGTRWRIRGRTFAHVLAITAGWPPAYARAAATEGPAVALTFRSTPPELDALRAARTPFFAPPWRGDEVGLLIDDGTDWDDVAELLTESYCAQAPRKLVASIERSRGER